MSISLRWWPKKKPFTQYLLSSNVWDILYTSLSDKEITRLSVHYSIWLKTKRLIAIHPNTKTITDLCEVEILSLVKL